MIFASRSLNALDVTHFQSVLFYVISKKVFLTIPHIFYLSSCKINKIPIKSQIKLKKKGKRKNTSLAHSAIVRTSLHIKFKLRHTESI